jgi:hypothetical protein
MVDSLCVFFSVSPSLTEHTSVLLHVSNCIRGIISSDSAQYFSSPQRYFGLSQSFLQAKTTIGSSVTCSVFINVCCLVRSYITCEIQTDFLNSLRKSSILDIKFHITYHGIYNRRKKPFIMPIKSNLYTPSRNRKFWSCVCNEEDKWERNPSHPKPLTHDKTNHVLSATKHWFSAIWTGWVLVFDAWRRIFEPKVYFTACFQRGGRNAVGPLLLSLRTAW